MTFGYCELYLSTYVLHFMYDHMQCILSYFGTYHNSLVFSCEQLLY